MRPSYSPVELLPHRPPRVLIDEIVDFDAESRTIVAAVDVREEWRGNWVAIEYMAQTAAALVGQFDRMGNAAAPARPGFLLGTRRLTLDVAAFETGRRYLVTATNDFADNETASFDCKMADSEGRVVASAHITAYRPSDLTAFMAEMKRA